MVNCVVPVMHEGLEDRLSKLAHLAVVVYKVGRERIEETRKFSSFQWINFGIRSSASSSALGK